MFLYGVSKEFWPELCSPKKYGGIEVETTEVEACSEYRTQTMVVRRGKKVNITVNLYQSYLSLQSQYAFQGITIQSYLSLQSQWYAF